MQIGLNAFVSAQALSGEGIILPQPVSDPAVSGSALEGTALVADTSDIWSYDGSQAIVASREYRLLIGGSQSGGPQGAPSVLLPAGSAGLAYALQLRVQVTVAPAIWSVWRTIATGLVQARPQLGAAGAAADGPNGYTGTVTTDTGDGTLYWLVTTSPSPPPVAALKAGASQPVTAPGPQAVNGAGLASATLHHIHFLQESAASVDSAILTSGGFTTAAEASGDPAAFAAGEWSVADLGTGGDARITVTALPDDGGEPLKTIEVRIGAGPWMPLALASTGAYDVIDGFVDGVATQVLLRVTNLVGTGPDGAPKTVTTSSAASVPGTFGPADWSIVDLATGGDARLTIVALPGDGGSAISALEYQIDGGGWTALGGIAAGAYVLGDRFADGVPALVALRASNAAGSGPASAPKSVTTSLADTTAPASAGAAIGAQTGSGNLPVTITGITEDAPDSHFILSFAVQPLLTSAQVRAGNTQNNTPAAASGSFSATLASPDPVVSGLSLASGTYHLYIVLGDASGNYSDPISAGSVVLDFTAPTVSALSPADGATGVAVDANLVMTFSESMKRQGTVTLKLAGGATIQSFNLASAGTWSTVTTTDDRITLDPTADFANGAALAVQWSGLEDTKGNALANNATDTVWNFNTQAGAALVEVQGIDGGTTTNNAASYESNAITIGSGANRLLVAAIAIATGPNGVTLAAPRATFGTAGRALGTGTAMVLRGPYNTSGRRTQVIFAILPAPATGTGTVQFDSGTSMVACLFQLYEFTGANQTLVTHALVQAVGGQNRTGLTTTGTVAAGQLLSVLSILGNVADESGTIAATGGATLDRRALSGTPLGLSQINAGFSGETVAAGSNGNGFTWSTAADADMATISIASA